MSLQMAHSRGRQNPFPKILAIFVQQLKSIRLTSVLLRTWMQIDWPSFRSKGVPIGEDYTLVLATMYVLGRERGSGRCQSLDDPGT